MENKLKISDRFFKTLGLICMYLAIASMILSFILAIAVAIFVSSVWGGAMGMLAFFGLITIGVLGAFAFLINGWMISTLAIIKEEILRVEEKVDPTKVGPSVMGNSNNAPNTAAPNIS